MAVSKLNPAAAGIPYGDNAGRPANATSGQPYFNGEVGRLELYTSTGWNNIVQETPGVASVSGHYYESDGYGTFTVSGTNFVDGAIAYAVGTNGTEYQATTTTYNSLVQLTTTFTGLSAAYEPYDLKITNPSNLFGLLPDAFNINESPVWSTSSGSLGSVYANSSVSKTVASTDAESNTITYSSSDLPSWLSLNSSTGALTGTSPVISSDTTYTFNISISDGSNSSVSRQFNIPVTAIPVVSGGALSSDLTYYYRTFTSNGNLVVSGKSGSFDIFTLAGGGSGVEGGGGAGAIIYYSNKLLSTGTYSAVVGGGGAGTGTATNGVNSRFGSLQEAYGGGYGGGTPTVAGAAGGCGGGGRRDGGSNGGASNQALGDATAKYGFAGGTSPTQGWTGAAGGGGTGAVGGAGSGNGVEAYERPGKGGAGTTDFASWISAINPEMSVVSGWSTATTGGYIGGGGTGAQEGTTFGADSVYTGGAGGGGGGERSTNTTFASAGVTNTGGGGGGQDGASLAYKAGGSGLVIVRYTKASVGG